jgi:ribosomal protein L37AE/L43A
MRDNPWVQVHVDAETAFQAEHGRRAGQVARALVEGEYAGAPDATECGGCGGTAHYRATVGAMMCPDCRWMAHEDGTPIGVAPGTTTGADGG